MSSEVGICNLALSHLGDEATVASIDPPEGSAQADHCAIFYPQARDTLLELHTWKFATRRVALSPLSVPSWNWGYAYAEPNQCIRLVSVLPSDSASEAESQPYDAFGAASGAPAIFTDQESATLVYITRVTDTSKFSALFTEALSRLLASYLAGPVLKGEQGAAMARKCMQDYMLLLGQAKDIDAKQRRVDPTHTAPWISAR